MSSLDHPAVAKVAAALAEAGQHRAAEGIRILPAEARTAAQAAEALGVPVGAIANSLVFRAVCGERSTPVLALTSGAHRADTDVIAALTGATVVEKADPEFVKRHTGQVIGGVAPVGHPEPLTTFVDTELERHEIIWAAAGHAKSVFPTTFADLVAVTGGRAAELGS
ncbi:MAG TPA: YbaK/EbsC family protein [Amycolatopsis sp.]|jgi:prolyl-tRNA editing enzyme YbaK/EbsC (Cys-tRNA(Pro) deacylase)|nr:YbaK/EbsC family protein [Amycolatopsis sp.]